MEDALVSFTMTGKADFKSMANAFIADIVRIQARAALSGLFGGALNALGLGGIGGRLGITPNAKGGVYDSPSLSVYRNQVHDTPKMFAFAKGAGVFGEAGPEAIMPLTRAPDGNLGVRALAPLPTPGGAPSVQVEVYVDASTGTSQVQATAGNRGGGDAAAQQQLGKMLGGMFKDMLTREMRPGGVLWSYRNGRA
jgi:lambda family phage tail tape measure protein